MTGEQMFQALASELRALGTDCTPTIEQLAEAVDKTAERVGYSDWEDYMGDDL